MKRSWPEHFLLTRKKEHTKRGEGLDWGQDATRARLWEFGDALNELDRIKSWLPQTYQAYMPRILENADGIRQVFTDYRQNHPDIRIPGELVSVVEVHEQLRELDPDRFPLCLIDISDKEFEAGAFALAARNGRPNASMFLRARLAEYDPERFRRVFGPKYAPAAIPRQRKFSEDEAADGDSIGLEYLKAWQTIEQVLSETPEYLEWAVGEIDSVMTRALSGNPAESYKADREQADVTKTQLFDLRNALRQLDLIKSQVPEAYAAQRQRVLEKADEIRQLFADYRTNHPDNYQPGDVVSVHQALRELDPKMFSLNFIDISDDEFKSLSIPGIQGIRKYPRSHAELAEYDPERFRRVFGPQYRFRISDRRKAFEDRAKDRHVRGYAEDLKNWQTIERALTEHRTE